MQIPPNSAAASAAGAASQSASKDSQGTGQASASAAAPAVSQVEQSNDANPDRDAQGQGDGLGDRGNPKRKEDEANDSSVEEQSTIVEIDNELIDAPPKPASNDAPDASGLDLMT